MPLKKLFDNFLKLNKCTFQGKQASAEIRNCTLETRYNQPANKTKQVEGAPSKDDIVTESHHCDLGLEVSSRPGRSKNLLQSSLPLTFKRENHETVAPVSPMTRNLRYNEKTCGTNTLENRPGTKIGDARNLTSS